MSLPQFPHLILRVPEIINKRLQDLLHDNKETSSIKVLPERGDHAGYYTFEIGEDEYPAMVRHHYVVNIFVSLS